MLSTHAIDTRPASSGVHRDIDRDAVRRRRLDETAALRIPETDSFAPGALPSPVSRGPASTPVVLLHASASSARQWQSATAALSGRFEAHTVEFHGHGAQPAWQGDIPMTLAHDAALVEPLLERLGGAHLVGHSYGAAVALRVASRRPALVRCVVAYEPVLFSLLQGVPAAQGELQTVLGVVSAMRRSLAQGRPERAAEYFVDSWSGPGAWTVLSPEQQQPITARVPVVLQQFEALFGDAFAGRDLAALRMPLLLLSGAQTVPTARRLVQRVCAAQPAAQHEVLDGMGHMGPITHADRFTGCVLEFLGALESRTARHERAPACPVHTFP